MNFPVTKLSRRSEIGLTPQRVRHAARARAGRPVKPMKWLHYGNDYGNDALR
jgi:hypothetical protein